MNQVNQREQLIENIRKRIPTQTKTEEKVLESWDMENVNWLNNLTQKELSEIEKTLSVLENYVAKHIQVKGAGEIWNWIGYKPNDNDFWDDFDNQVHKYNAALWNDKQYFDYLDQQYEIIFKFSEIYAKYNEDDLIELKKEYKNFQNSTHYPYLASSFSKLRKLRCGIDAKYLPFVGKGSNEPVKMFEKICNKFINVQEKRLARMKKEKVMNTIVNKIFSDKEQNLIKKYIAKTR